ncbi:hypothetical protein PR048_006688 [Dryococelus australis]|uniref:Retrovirus-related Pol polyprotein from transposon TNT 1-94-like beta-barrel domain-containing protein n=1 Tax=Dryococelus australis TaxID=614101 RepID=A0ABQ9IBN4_9NEOP|nr:hypothetical protein PR048_006688 [Dryococelus australis]
MQEKCNDEWIGTLLLAGLSDHYKPIIMALENSGTKITGDSIKTEDWNTSEETALYVKRQPHREVKCFICNKPNHIARNWPDRCNSPGASKKPTSQRDESRCSENWSNNSKRAFLAAHSHHYLKSCNNTVIAADGSDLIAYVSGSVDLKFQNGDEIVEVVAKDVLHIQNSAVNLLSASKVVKKKGYKVTFDRNVVCMYYDRIGKLVATAYLRNGIYCMNISEIKQFFLC